MQYFVEGFDPQEYDSVTDLSGNEKVTLMCHNKTKKLVVRKKISGINKELYKQLIYVRQENLAQIMGVEETTSNCYTYEKYINGETLAEIIADGPIPEEKVVQWIRQLCRAIRLLHEQSPIIVHRDIKPGNIMLSSDGVIKLIDFDASKTFTPNKQRDTQLVGTPSYAAPEQYGFASSDPRTDIYAIGILFHELLTGHKPNEINIPYEGRYKKMIRRCIELDPKKRYQSVRGLEHRFVVYKIRRLIERLPGVRICLCTYCNAKQFMLIEHIPGFRTGIWWKKKIALSVYFIMALITFGVFSLIWNSEGIMKALIWLECWGVINVPPYLLITNFFCIREKIPLLRSKVTIVKVLGIILYLFIWLLLLLFSAILIEQQL